MGAESHGSLIDSRAAFLKKVVRLFLWVQGRMCQKYENGSNFHQVTIST